VRAEWRRIEADARLLAKLEGNDLYALHELGYRFTDRIGDLTPMQRWALIAIRRHILKQIEEQRKKAEARSRRAQRRRRR